MAGSINKAIVVGNLGRDPEIRTTQDGREIANLTLATSDSWRDKATGERRERTEWHRIVIFSEGLVKITKNYLQKGSKVYIEGALQTRKWVDNSGVEKYTTEIVLQGFNCALTMLDSRNSSADSGQYQNRNQSQPANASAPSSGASSGGKTSSNEFAEEIDDEIPF